MHGRMKLVSLLIIAVLVLSSISCISLDLGDLGIERVEVGETQEESQVIELEDVDEIRADVRVGTGNLDIRGGASELLEADFTYNISEWKPEVTYSEGRITVRQPSVKKLPSSDDIEYEWDLRFNDAVPMDLRLEIGAGEGTLDLSSLSVTNLDMKLGAGNVEVDLRDNASLERLELDMGAGDLMLDLRGAWEDDVYVNIQGGVGQINLTLPEDIGVRVDVTKGIGSLEAEGFRIKDGDYVNDAYGELDVTLNVVLQAGVGQVTLELD